MASVVFTTDILKFHRHKEKTGWTYIVVAARHARKMKPGCRVSFRVKGSLDRYAFVRTSLLPAGNGDFILPVNAAMRKALGKKQGDRLRVTMDADAQHAGDLPQSAEMPEARPRRASIL